MGGVKAGGRMRGGEMQCMFWKSLTGVEQMMGEGRSRGKSWDGKLSSVCGQPRTVA